MEEDAQGGPGLHVHVHTNEEKNSWKQFSGETHKEAVDSGVENESKVRGHGSHRTLV